jgi:hypothetical protein
MYCRYCGYQLEEQDAYCSKCGKSVSNENINVSDTPQIVLNDHRDSDLPFDSKLEEVFVGKNYDYYINKWNKLENKKSKISWNWAAFFLGPFWFGYRKMYIPVLFIAVMYFILDLFLYIIQYQFTEETYYFDPIENLLLLPLSIFVSLFGNYYYLKHTDRNIEKVNLQPLNPEQKRTWLKRKGGSSWLGVVFTIAIIFVYGFATAYFLPTNIDQVSFVKDGSFYEYPTTTIGEGFNDFFFEPEWEYVSADSAYDIVRFTGVADQDGVDVEVTIDFILTDESFDIHSATVDGELISEDEIFSLLDVVFNETDSNSITN